MLLPTGLHTMPAPLLESCPSLAWPCGDREQSIWCPAGVLCPCHGMSSDVGPPVSHVLCSGFALGSRGEALTSSDTSRVQQ